MLSPWFITAAARPSPAGDPQVRPARIRLFAFSHAGRGASLFFPWRRALPGWIELVAAQLPGREGRLKEPALTRMDAIVAELANAILPHLDRPYALFGHSMGALVSYELARALRRMGAPAPSALLLSGRRAPTVPDADPPLHVLGDPEFVDAVRSRYGGIPQAVLDQPELMDLLLPTLRRDIEAIETHVHRPEPALPQPFLLYGGEDDRLAPRDSLDAWGALSSQPSKLRLFPGGHFYLQPQQAELIGAITRDLAHLLPAYGALDGGVTLVDGGAAGGWGTGCSQ